MSEQARRHVLGLSGGKDSAALAVHMNNNYPNIDVEYYFTDTGYELNETYDYLDKLKTRLDKPIKYIQPNYYSTVVLNIGILSFIDTFGAFFGPPTGTSYKKDNMNHKKRDIRKIK